MERFRKSILHTPILSIYPVLALIAFNISQVDSREVWRALILACAGGMALWLLLQVFLRNWMKSGLLASLLLTVFYSYGQVYLAAKNFAVGGILIGRHRYLLPLAAGLVFLGIRWLTRKEALERLNEGLNWIGIVLLLLPTSQILSYEISGALEGRDTQPASVLEIRQPTNAPRPDIYYIILDAYGRADTLQNLYGFDNQPFLDNLERLGFYVAPCSQSNYPETKISLGSALNMDYEQNIWAGDNYESRAFDDLITHSRVRQALEEQGYRTVAFQSGHRWSELRDAGVYLSPEDVSTTWLARSSTFGSLNGFEAQLLETTLFSVVNDFEILSRRLNTRSAGYARTRQRVQFALDGLANVPAIPGPKFVFAHIVSPHRPFVFGPAGEEIIGPGGELSAETDYATGYTSQVAFLNLRLVPLLETIIASSEQPPVIILQGDHGPDDTTPENRATILNAYLFPAGEGSLYPGISPVNTFRVLFNELFGARLPLLADLHYKSTPEMPVEDYRIIPNTGAACSP